MKTAKWSKMCLSMVKVGIPPLNHNFHVITQPSKNFIFSCSHCSYTIFILTSCLYTQVMVNLILINVQYLQNVFFFWKRFKSLKSLFLRFSPADKKSSLQDFPLRGEGGGQFPPLNAIWKTLDIGLRNLKLPIWH